MALARRVEVGNGSTRVRYYGMERLWAPWRLTYVKSASSGDGRGCVFCDKARERDDRAALIVHRGATCMVMLNLYPYQNGHLMVAPYRHLAQPGDLDAEERAEMWQLFDESLAALERAFAPHGANAGINLGRVAGAGIEGHLHLHVVPRWAGDTNFMPVLADVRVMAQHLDDTWLAVRDAWIGSGPQ
jgi:ATP adenylyltransferase